MVMMKPSQFEDNKKYFYRANNSKEANRFKFMLNGHLNISSLSGGRQSVLIWPREGGIYAKDAAKYSHHVQAKIITRELDYCAGGPLDPVAQTGSPDLLLTSSSPDILYKLKVYKTLFLMIKEGIDHTTITEPEIHALFEQYFPVLGDTNEEMFAKLVPVYALADELELESGIYQNSVKGITREYTYVGGVSECYCECTKRLLSKITENVHLTHLESDEFGFMDEIRARNDLMVK